MSRQKFDQSACDQLAQCVRDIESETDAELVIVVRARSGSYRHADYLWGALLAFATLLFLLFSPFEFAHYWVAIDVAVSFIVGTYISSRSSALRRLLTTKKQRAEAVSLRSTHTRNLRHASRTYHARQRHHGATRHLLSEHHRAQSSSLSRRPSTTRPKIRMKVD